MKKKYPTKAVREYDRLQEQKQKLRIDFMTG